MINPKKIFSELTDKKLRPLYKSIVLLSIPAFVELFLTSLFNMVDMVMVGKMNPDAAGDISSVGITNQPFFLLISFFAAVNVGTTTLVAWRVGSGQKKEASSILRQSLLVNFGMSLILGTVGILAAAHVMGFMGGDLNPEVVLHATNYFTIACAGLPFLAIGLAVTAALRGAGQTKIPMFYNLVANALNVLMNYILIFGHFGFPRMGVEGAALATTISRVISATIAVLYVTLNKNSAIRLKIRASWKPRLDILKPLFSIGIPSSLEQMAIQSGLLLFHRVVASLGDLAYDAHQVAISINSLVFSVSQAFGITTTTLVGQAVGAGDYDLAERSTRLTRRIARLTTFVIAVFLVLASTPLSRLYTSVDEVIKIAAPTFYFVAVIQLIQSTQMSTAGALRGAGDTMFPFYSSLLGIWLCRLPCAILFCWLFDKYGPYPGFGLVGAWLSFFIDQLVRNFVINRRFSKGKWKTIKSKKDKT